MFFNFTEILYMSKMNNSTDNLESINVFDIRYVFCIENNNNINKRRRKKQIDLKLENI